MIKKILLIFFSCILLFANNVLTNNNTKDNNKTVKPLIVLPLNNKKAENKKETLIKKQEPEQKKLNFNNITIIYKNFLKKEKDKNKIKIVQILYQKIKNLNTSIKIVSEIKSNFNILETLEISPLIISKKFVIQNNLYNWLLINNFLNNFNQYIALLKKEISNLYKQKNNDIITFFQKVYYQYLIRYKKLEYSFYKKNYNYFYKKILTILKNYNFTIVKNVLNNLKVEKLILKEKKKELELLTLNKEKWILLKNQQNAINIEKYIEINKTYQLKHLKKLLKDYLYLWAYYYKNKNISKLLEENNKILNIIKKIETLGFINDENNYLLNYPNVKKALDILLKKEYPFLFIKKKENNKNSQKEWIKKIDYYIFDYPVISIGNNRISLIKLLGFVLILIIGYFLGKNWKNFIYRIRDKKNLSYSNATLLANIGYYLILMVFSLLGLNEIGINLTSLTMIAGALSIGIGFGLQNIVSNFVSGIILMFEKSIKVGDYIQIDENIKGTVSDILMRSTIIKTNDNIDLIIPNQNLIQNNVINLTLTDDYIRYKIPFSVAYGTNIEKMKEILLSELDQSNLPYIRSSNKKYQPTIVFTQMADSSLNFELYIWVKGKFTKMPKRTTSMFLTFIYNTLNKYDFVIPFPQLDIHLKKS